MSALPSTEVVDVGALSRLFEDTTNSYKYLFFRALLQAFKDSAYKDTTFSLADLAIGMLAAGWHPSRVYRLSFGIQDQVATMIEKIDLGSDGPIPHHQLKARLSKCRPDWGLLMRFVPYRLIAPFFHDQLRRVPDHQRNGRIASLASDHFATVRPLYRWTGNDMVELHPEWASYLSANFPIVSAWAERRWISYLQARNPTVPAISEKTAAPLRRDPLTKQMAYWKTVFSVLGEPPLCIYSGRPLDPGRFDLDHFLPWTFICHDATWNLLPVSPEANSAKGNRLPDVSYLPDLVEAQHRGLVAARQAMKDPAWMTATSPFVGDLRIPEEQLLDPVVLLDAYNRLVAPQLDIARGIGFQPGWKYVPRRKK